MLGFGLALALGLLPACSLFSEISSRLEGVGSSDAPEIGSSIGQRAPSFELAQLEKDGTLSSKDLRGQVVLITFWASWCGPCRVELPALNEAWPLYRGKDVAFVGVSVDEDPVDARDFLEQVPVSFTTLIDADGAQAAGPWQVASLPTTLILDRSGVVRARHLGYTPRQLRQSLDLVDDLLEERTP